MTSDFVRDIIRRSNRNLLLGSMVGIIGVIIAGVITYTYLYNFFLGPFPADREQLLAIKDLNGVQKYYLTVESDDVLDTGVQYVSTDTKSGVKTVKAYYEALSLDDKYLLAKSGTLLDGNKFTGSLVPLPAQERAEVIEKVDARAPGVKNDFLPFMLDMGDFRTPGYIGLAIAAVVLLLSLYALSRWMARNSDMTKHPIMRALERFGDPEAVASQIEMEIGSVAPAKAPLIFTRNWVLQAKSASLTATRLSDVMWAYKKVTQHRTNGIPTGKTFAALIWDKHGVCITVNGKEKVVDQALLDVLNKSPGAIAGYSAEIQQMWKQNRAGFVAAVEQRRQQVSQ